MRSSFDLSFVKVYDLIFSFNHGDLYVSWVSGLYSYFGFGISIPGFYGISFTIKDLKESVFCSRFGMILSINKLAISLFISVGFDSLFKTVDELKISSFGISFFPDFLHLRFPNNGFGLNHLDCQLTRTHPETMAKGKCSICSWDRATRFNVIFFNILFMVSPASKLIFPWLMVLILWSFVHIRKSVFRLIYWVLIFDSPFLYRFFLNWYKEGRRLSITSSDISHSEFHIFFTLLRISLSFVLHTRVLFFGFVLYHSVSFFATMAQEKCLGTNVMNVSSSSGPNILRIKVPRFDNSDLIAGYSKTLIGRCFNPRMQNMDSLLHMMPKFWKVDERCVGADLGMGKFQFDFDKDEDIQEVLKLEPFHFDGWMVSLVRWQPIMDPSYPSELTFWIKNFGVPLQFWAEQTFTCIGERLGLLREVDINGGRIKVSLDGLKPLFFDSDLDFDGGEEVTVKFKYERLHGVCRTCHSLCHEMESCPQNKDFQTVGNGLNVVEPSNNEGVENQLGGPQSFKVALVNGSSMDTQSTVHQGIGHQSSAKRSLRFEKSTGGFSSSQWQQKAKGKHVVSRSSKLQAKSGGKSMTYVHKNHQEVSLKIGNSISKASDVGVSADTRVSAVSTNSEPILMDNIMENEDGQILLSEFETKRIHDLSSGTTNLQDVNSGKMDQENGNIQPMVEEFSSMPSLATGKSTSSLLIDSLGEEGEMLGFEGINNECSDLMMDDLVEGEVDAPTVETVIELSRLEKELQEDINEGRIVKKKQKALGKNVIMQEGNAPKKHGKANIMLKGVNSRKRNMQNLASPRKKVIGKNGVTIGDGSEVIKEDSTIKPAYP